MNRLSQANTRVFREAAARGGVIGTTVAVLLVFGRRYACLWAGDSRIYLIRRGRPTLLTRDHSEANMLLDSGAITDEEARTWRRNVLARAVGIAEDVDTMIEVRAGEADVGDRFLICSDGLYTHLETDEMAAVVTALPPQPACDRLVDLTLERGASDNVTVVVVECGRPNIRGGRP